MRGNTGQVDAALVPYDLMTAARDSWDDALAVGRKHGYRNAQVTVLAPTGTIGFMMDCDTTGIEPDIALVKYKRLVGGGMLKIVNGTVPEALAAVAEALAKAGDLDQAEAPARLITDPWHPLATQKTELACEPDAALRS